MISIQPLLPVRFSQFASYLSNHLSDNGTDESGYFQPLPGGVSELPRRQAQAFHEALGVPLDAPAWRRAWVAQSEDQKIVGHVDLRGYPDAQASHRCILGMGVDRNFRMQGLGHRLLEHAIRWAQGQDDLEWIDLQVVSSNRAAIALYNKASFAYVGTIPNMFRIEGGYLSQDLMTRSVLDDGAL